jgi:hypothetical protein
VVAVDTGERAGRLCALSGERPGRRGLAARGGVAPTAAAATTTGRPACGEACWPAAALALAGEPQLSASDSWCASGPAQRPVAARPAPAPLPQLPASEAPPSSPEGEQASAGCAAAPISRRSDRLATRAALVGLPARPPPSCAPSRCATGDSENTGWGRLSERRGEAGWWMGEPSRPDVAGGPAAAPSAHSPSEDSGLLRTPATRLPSESEPELVPA